MAGQNRKYTIIVRKITKYCIVNISKFTTNECLQYLSDLKLKLLLDRRSRRAILALYIYNWLAGFLPINVETTEPELGPNFLW